MYNVQRCIWRIAQAPKDATDNRVEAISGVPSGT